MKQINILIALLLCSASVQAQTSSNDLGNTPLPAQQGPKLTPINPSAATSCPPTGYVQTSFAGGATQLGRIFRDAIASSCPSKTYPGLFNASTTYNNKQFVYANTSNATACVTVNFDPNSGTTPCGTNAHMSAYLNAYDPANQATNYVGDVGSSLTQPFSFNTPANTSLVLVATNTSAAAMCDFSFQVTALPCSVPATPVPTLNPLMLPMLGLLLGALGLMAVRLKH